MSAYEKLIATLREAEADIIAGYGGNKAAATRARKALQEVRTEHSVAARNELLAIKKGEAGAIKVASLLPADESEADES